MPSNVSQIPFTAKLTVEMWIAVFLFISALTYLLQGFHPIGSLAAGLAVASTFIAGSTVIILILKIWDKRKERNI